MNRKKITSRSRGKQIEHKQARAAEKQAIKTGRTRTIRSDRWGMRPDQPPLADKPSNGKPHRKNKKKDKSCPERKGKRHAYLRDIEVHELVMPWSGRRFRVETVFKLCVYCGRERTVKSKYTQL